MTVLSATLAASCFPSAASRSGDMKTTSRAPVTGLVEQPTSSDDRFDSSLFVDPDPVPAVAELRDGSLSQVPATRLV